MNTRINPNRIVAVVLILMAAILVVATGIFNPGKASQEPEKEEMMAMMGPMMEQMMESMMETMLKVISKPDTAEQLATFTRNYYTALLFKGFSEDEALKIVTSMGIPSVPSMK